MERCSAWEALLSITRRIARASPGKMLCQRVAKMKQDFLAELESLLQRAHQGDTVAQDKIFGYLQKRFRAIVSKMLRRRPDAAVSDSDVIQELSLRMWKMFRKEVDFSSAQHFLSVAGKNLRWAAMQILGHRRKRHAQSLNGHGSDATEKSGDELLPSHPGDPPERLEVWQRFHELVERKDVLSPEERQVVTLRWYHGLRQREIASLLQVSERTVKRYWHSAKKKLQQHLDLDALR